MAVGKTSSPGKQTRLRHLWLASLGAAVVARREARSTVVGVAGKAGKLRQRTVGVAGDVAAIARGGLLAVREQAEPTIGEVVARIGQGLAPAMERVGLLPKQPVRKPSARRAARKPAARKKPTPRPMSARKQAEQRVARKGR